MTKFVTVKLGTNFPCLPRENGKAIALEITKQKTESTKKLKRCKYEICTTGEACEQLERTVHKYESD